MENNELVTDVTENTVEQPVEEVVEDSTPVEEQNVEKGKYYTDDELNALIGKKLHRQEMKLKKEFDKQISPYLEAENILNQGMETSNIQEASSKLKNFYLEKGMTINDYKPSTSEYEIEALAKYEADSIIESGFDDVVSEVDRLADIGVDNMNPQEKLVFSKLAEYRKGEEEKKEMAKLGINKEALEDSAFVEFSNNLNPKLSLSQKYEMYTKYNKPNIEKMGSMKTTTTKDTSVKDFYTLEEAKAFTKADFDKNPKLYEAVVKSSQSGRW